MNKLNKKNNKFIDNISDNSNNRIDIGDLIQSYGYKKSKHKII